MDSTNEARDTTDGLAATPTTTNAFGVTETTRTETTPSLWTPEPRNEPITRGEEVSPSVPGAPAEPATPATRDNVGAPETDVAPDGTVETDALGRPVVRPVPAPRPIYQEPPPDAHAPDFVSYQTRTLPGVQTAAPVVDAPSVGVFKGLIEGRIVHYVLARGPKTGEHRPAIVVKVWRTEDGKPQPDGCCQLTVFTDWTNDKPVELMTDSAPSTAWGQFVVYSETPAPHTWHWIEWAD